MTASTRLSTRRVEALAAMCLTALAGCAPQLQPPPSALPLPAPTAERVEYSHDVLFGGGEVEPSTAELSRLATFLGQLPPGAAHGFRLVGRADTPAGQLHALDLSSRRVRATEAYLRARVAAGSEITTSALGSEAPVGDRRDRPGHGHGRVEVRVDGHLVRLPGCPDWSRDPAFDPWNLPLSNLGCANAINLGLMVANPADLAGGRELGPADGTREAEAVARYRTDKVKDLREEAIEQ